MKKIVTYILSHSLCPYLIAYEKLNMQSPVMWFNEDDIP